MLALHWPLPWHSKPEGCLSGGSRSNARLCCFGNRRVDELCVSITLDLRPSWLSPLTAKPPEMSDLIQLHCLGQFFGFSMVMPIILPCPSAHQPQDPIPLLLSSSTSLYHK